MFHLLSHTDGIGGESLFVDGYAAAAHLRDNQPSLYAYFCRQRILYHACGNTEVGEFDNAALGINGARVFHGGLLHKDKYLAKEIGRGSETVDSRTVPVLIRWNNDDRDAQTWRSLNSLERWHRAAREWDKILKMRQFEIKVQLRPGQPIIFNNWRYLHGRTGFSGKRRMCGGYSKSFRHGALHALYRLVVALLHILVLQTSPGAVPQPCSL
jgi:trimethyllysine dioxygenase